MSIEPMGAGIKLHCIGIDKRQKFSFYNSCLGSSGLGLKNANILMTRIIANYFPTATAFQQRGCWDLVIILVRSRM